MLDDFSTELKRLGGGASSVLDTAQPHSATRFSVQEKPQNDLAEWKGAGSLAGRSGVKIEREC